MNKVINTNELKIYTFDGVADGSNLSKYFDVNELIGKYLFIKDIHFYWYSTNKNVLNNFESDSYSDPGFSGLNPRFSQKLAGSLLNPLDIHQRDNKIEIGLKINGSKVPIFKNNQKVYPMISELKNLNVLYPEKINSSGIDFNFRGDYTYNFTNMLNVEAVFVRVLLICALLDDKKELYKRKSILCN